MSSPDIKLGINTPIPGAGGPAGAGYIIGRTRAGTGAAHLIPIDDLAKTMSQRGSGAAGSAGQASLPSSGVTAGTYTNATITVSATGILTAASSGSAGLLPLITKDAPPVIITTVDGDCIGVPQ